MGEAAPAQAASSGFSQMLGASMVGSMPAGVPGTVSAPRGSAVPQLHSAIVERLRARIELCRRHHSTCESRYQRGQAESSDREREATLQLLNIVQQGTGNRKTKGNRSSTQHPLEYSRVNGEQKPHTSSDAEPKLSTRIALQGSLRRKIEGPPAYTLKQNGLSCMGTTPDFKRVRMANVSLPAGSSAVDSGQSQNLAGPMAMGHALQSKDPFMMPHVGNDLFNMTLRGVKKEPTDVHTCSHALTDPAVAVFDFKDEGGGPIDPELQDLFDELTKSVPPLNDLELEKILKQDDEFGLEKILKQDDDFGLDLGRPSSASSAHPCSLLDKPIKTEYTADFGQVQGSSSHLRPASAGPSFSMANPALATSSVVLGHMAHGHVAQASVTSSRGLPAWPEMSHAEQLKQMAANQQPKQSPNSLIHHHQQQSQAARLRNWPSAMDPNSSPFGQEMVATTSLLSQPGISPQSSGQGKGVANCLFKPTGYNQSNPTDIKALSTKPMLNFTPKAPSSITSHMTGSQSKPSIQNQQASGSQNIQFQLPLQSSSCLQPKPLSQRHSLNQHGPGVNFKITQQRQAMALGSHLSANSHLVALCPPQRQCSSALNAQQKHIGKGQRHLSQPQHQSSDKEKFTIQDQFNRHLTRPPPDYKQPQGPSAGQTPTQYPGLTSSSVTNNGSDQSDIQGLSCHTHNGQRVKAVTSSGDRRVHVRSDPHSSSLEVHTCASKLHQPNSQVQIHQNKPQFQVSNTQVVTFQSGIVSTAPHARTSASQDTMLSQGLDGVTTSMSRETSMSWGTSTEKSSTLPVLDAKRQQNTVPPRGDQTNGHFPTRPVGPPNQIAPHSGQISLNPANRNSAPRPSHVRIPPLPGVSSLNLTPPEQQGCISTFVGTAQSPGNYQNSRAGRLTFDFLQDGDNTVPGINADSDFIDSLLKSSSGNDDWMKDINLEEILGSHS